MKIKNGFSIISVLVAAGLLGILALVFSKMIMNSQKGQKNVENSLDFDVLRSSIALVINNPSHCAVAFKNSVSPSPTAAQFPNPSGVDANKKLESIVLGASTIAKVGMNLGGGLKIDKLELQDISPVSTPNKFEVALIVEATKASESYGAPKLSNASNPFRFSISTNPSTSEIIGCGGGSCPIGFVNSGGGFCIEGNRSYAGTLSYLNTINQCATLGASLCTASEWMLACSNGLLADHSITQIEWLDGGSYGDMVLGTPNVSGCIVPRAGNIYNVGTYNLHVRCCTVPR